MRTLIEKAFKELFGMNVKMINRPDIDIAIYVMNKKLSKLNEEKLSKLEPDFTITSMGSGFDVWTYKINTFDSDRESYSTFDSINTYNLAEQAFVGLMKELFGSEILMKFIQKNV